MAYQEYPIHDRLIADGWRIEEIIAVGENTTFAEELAGLAVRVAAGEAKKEYSASMVIPLSFIMADGLRPGETLEDSTMHALYVKRGNKYPASRDEGVSCRMVRVTEAHTGGHLFYRAPGNPVKTLNLKNR